MATLIEGIWYNIQTSGAHRNGVIDYDAVSKAINNRTKMVLSSVQDCADLPP